MNLILKDHLAVDLVSLDIQKLVLNVLLECAPISMNAWTQLLVILFLVPAALTPQVTLNASVQ